MSRSIFDSKELDQIRDLARRFAQDRVAPGWKAREKADRMDMDLVREMGGLGLIAPELPEEFGGMGAGTLCAGTILEEIARADFTFGYVPLLPRSTARSLSGSPKPKSRGWLTKLTAGKILLAIALTEPKGGSDAANLGLRMERDGGHYVLNGEKTPNLRQSGRGGDSRLRPHRPRIGRAASPPSSCR